MSPRPDGLEGVEGRPLSRWDRSEEALEWRRLYWTARWKRERLSFLQAHPICRYCQAVGNIRPATVVDHVTPHKGDLDLFWDQDNWQPLCKSHHDAAKAQEERGGYSSLSDADGYPIDPNHPQNRKRKPH